MSETVLIDPLWGPLRVVDSNKLDEELGRATDALMAASQASMYLTESGMPIHSPLAMMLGGLSQVVDALIDQRDGQERDDQSDA